MESITKSARSKMSGLVGSFISLSLVFGGSMAFAEGLTGFSADSGASRLIGNFSAADLDQLDHATTAEATASRVAAMSSPAPAATRARSRATAPGEASMTAGADVFPHSGRLLPMLVTRPDAAVPVMAGVTLRPGLVQPVGIPAAALRSATPAERSTR